MIYYPCLLYTSSVFAVIPPVTALLKSKTLEQKVIAFEEEGMEAVLSDFVRCFQRKLLFPDQKRLILKEYPENAGELLKKAGFIREMQDYVLYR